MIENKIEQMTRIRRELAQKLAFFDANVWLGKPAEFLLANELRFSELQNTLQKYYISGALVSHWRSKAVSVQDGNSALQEIETSLDNNTFTIWTGLPLFPAESGPLPGIGKPGIKLRGVRIFPKLHNFQLTSWCVGSLCEWLIEHNMPLFIWHIELNWSELFNLAQVFPKLKIVVETQTQKIIYHTRSLFALMREHSNVSVELSNFSGQGLIEYVVREFGANRLIFGSFLPVNDPLVAIGMILDADISESDKALIAHGNITRLVQEVLA